MLPRIFTNVLVALAALWGAGVFDSAAKAFPANPSGEALMTSAGTAAAAVPLNVASRGYPGYHGYHGYYRYPRHYGYRGYGGGYGFYFGPGPWWGYQDPYYYESPAYGSYGDAHVQWCLNRYRSYDSSTDTFLGYDGYRHACAGPY